MRRKLYFGLILFFAFFYLFSGTIKIINIDNFLYVIRAYNFKLFIYLSLAVPVIEIFIGLMIILRVWLKYIMLVSLLLLITFTLIFIFGHFKLHINDCGCFGGVKILKMSPLIFFIRNIILILLTIAVYRFLNKSHHPSYMSFPKFITITLIVIISSLTIGIRSNINKYLKPIPYSLQNIESYHTNEFLNKNISETILSKYITTSKDSTTLILIFSLDCPNCLVSAITLNKYIENNIVENVIGLTYGSRKEEQLFNKKVNPKFKYKKVNLIDIVEITGYYPLSFYIKNDTIKHVIKGVLPDHLKFQDLYIEN